MAKATRRKSTHKPKPKRANARPSTGRGRPSAPARMAKRGKNAAPVDAHTESYVHKDAESPMRPEVGTQAQFKKKKAPKTYRYDSSLAPALDYDGQNKTREEGEALLKAILDAKSVEEAKAAAVKLKALSKPFLNWAGKAERLSFDVPTLPLFIHERLSTKAIIETLTGHVKDRQATMFDLFGDPHRSVTDQVLHAYEYPDKWVNRMILGDSLVGMNSLLQYEGLGGQVQMIYMDPPYGVKFGSNFQPFVRKREVSHNDDDDFTREPEMVQAYRDTWEVGLHSYLTYLRDRLLLARDLLAPSGSVFVQISDENLHHVREVMDEVFGGENIVAQITFLKTSTTSSDELNSVSDYILWYAKDRDRAKIQTIYLPKAPGFDGASQYTWAEHPTGERVNYGSAEKLLNAPPGSRIFTHSTLTSQRPAGGSDLREFDLKGRAFRPGKGTFKTDLKGMKAIASANRFLVLGDSLRFVRYLNDFPAVALGNVWSDTVTSGFADKKVYVVQTQPLVVQRCLLMATDPGDLVLDPTCGSGTTAYVAEQWGRRWITMDTSRVPLALARQRLLTATFPYYLLKEESRGPGGGFVYKRKQNNKGEEVGGIVPHVTLKSIANNEPPGEEVLVDRPEIANNITRVTGPFVVEATIPTPMESETESTEETSIRHNDCGGGAFRLCIPHFGSVA